MDQGSCTSRGEIQGKEVQTKRTSQANREMQGVGNASGSLLPANVGEGWCLLVGKYLLLDAQTPPNFVEERIKYLNLTSRVLWHGVVLGARLVRRVKWDDGLCEERRKKMGERACLTSHVAVILTFRAT